MSKEDQAITNSVDSKLRIAICEDMREDADHLCGLIAESPIAADVRVYPNEKALLDAFSPGFFHLILFDIFLGADVPDGIGAARKIRGSDADVRLAFTTGSRDFTMQSYGVNASQYLLKPVSPKDLNTLLADTERYWRNRDETVAVLSDRKRVLLLTRDILFIESANKQSLIHIVGGIVPTRQTIEELESLLPSPPFHRCHRSNIVNMEHVIGMDGLDFVMADGYKVYVRRPDQWKMKRAYHNYVASLAKGAE